ncbi:hypothetical protein DKT75_00830 [Leucothrix arctica]|uniref:Uncharacterized protein n=1 Tax=Leucothrix arctica TaxID=1481894 RepID=A0A317CM94_9GAMM|nr:hypothetical protein DKT75_00830 [Leucothrix arctica]
MTPHQTLFYLFSYINNVRYIFLDQKNSPTASNTPSTNATNFGYPKSGVFKATDVTHESRH